MIIPAIELWRDAWSETPPGSALGFAGIRIEMRDFLLTAKDTSFANLEGVSVAR